MIETIRRLIARDTLRTEAEVQADIRSLLLSAPLQLHEGDLEIVLLESPVGDRRRIDVEVGSAVIEVKRDLRRGRTKEEAREQLGGYVETRAEQTGRRYVGILSDGAEWVCYDLRNGELEERLLGIGFAVAQATISRDLEHLGAVKIRRGGTVSYALPDQLGGASWAGPRLEAVLREWARSIEPAGNLIIIKTPPGSAHLVGVALDQAELPELAGTISGDDTVFLAVREPATAVSLVDKLSAFDRPSFDRARQA